MDAGASSGWCVGWACPTARDIGRCRARWCSRHALPVAPNLVARNVTAERPDPVWPADASYVPMAEGWLCLAAARDMATRQSNAERQPEIVGWSMADHLRAELCAAALVMALQRCQPAKG